MKKPLHSVFILLVVALPFSLLSQPFIQSLQRDFVNQSYNRLSKSERPYHTLSKSFISSQFDSISNEESGWSRRQHKSWIMRKTRNENLIVVDTFDFKLTIDPVFNFRVGADRMDSTNGQVSDNTRGFLVQGAIGKKLAFYSSFYENQSFFPQYLDNEIALNGVVPGQGRPKVFKDVGYDYAMASGAISYSPAKWLNVQAGHGKNFIGDGYRSLVLSDNSFNYPYLKTTANFFNNKLSYQLLYASLQHLQRLPATTSSEAQFIRKAGTFHSLSFSPTPLIEFSLVEGVVYQNWDSTGTKKLPWNYYMPIIGLNTGIEGYESNSAKVISALNMRINPLPGKMIYGQFVLDGFDNNSDMGFQLGVAAYDAFTLKNLVLQIEWNNISQGIYKHQNEQISYEHYGGHLAHPTGSDLNELVGMLQYSFRDFFITGKWVYSDRQSPVKNSLPGGVVIEVMREEKVVYQHYSIGYLLNSKTNMKIKLGYSLRDLNYANGYESTAWYYVSFVTDLQNVYYDF